MQDSTNNPDPLVGDPNDRTAPRDPLERLVDPDLVQASRAQDAAGFGQSLKDIVPRSPTWQALVDVRLERDNQRVRFDDDHDDANTEYDWALKRNLYELRLAGDVAEPYDARTRDALVKLAAICVAHVEALDRRKAKIRASISDNPDNPVGFRDVVTHHLSRDGFRVVREFVGSGLEPIALFVRTVDLPVTREELARMDDEAWRKVVRDAAAPSLNKLTERASSERELAGAGTAGDSEQL